MRRDVLGGKKEMKPAVKHEPDVCGMVDNYIHSEEPRVYKIQPVSNDFSGLQPAHTFPLG